MKNYNNSSDLDFSTSQIKIQRPDKRILVVDDDQEILNWFKSIRPLQSKYDFHFLNDELKILEAIQATDPDMVFLDICLNSISGRKIGEIIKVTSYFNLPIIYMSSQKNWNLGENIGDQFFLPKPLDKNIVQLKIQKFLKG